MIRAATVRERRTILKTSAEVLEFEALRQLVGRYIASPLGKRELEKVRPIADRVQLDTALAEAGEAIQYLHAALHPQAGGRGGALRIEFGGIPHVVPAGLTPRLGG